jgi:hypothetical protein
MSLALYVGTKTTFRSILTEAMKTKRRTGGSEVVGGRWIGVVAFLAFAALTSSCSLCEKEKEVDASRVRQIRQNMSEEAVVELLGEPRRVKTGQYEPDNPAFARILSYKLDDGRTWLVVMNEHDKLIGSGEKDTGRPRKNKKLSQKARGNGGSARALAKRAHRPGIPTRYPSCALTAALQDESLFLLPWQSLCSSRQFHES